VLVVAPAPLMVQWQDELADKFDERFVRASVEQVRWQWAAYLKAYTYLGDQSMTGD